jgi:endonuclease/exonuclease/phosphatase family metal-dependent hydrolase
MKLPSRINLVLLFIALHLGVGLGFSDDNLNTKPNGFLQRKTGEEFQLRVMCWNVKTSSIFPPDGKRYESFGRILRAVNPDLVCLQEVFDDLNQLPQIMQRHLPQAGRQQWHVHSATDNAVVSRFPLRLRERELPIPFPIPQAGLPDYHYGQAMCLVDLPDEQADRDCYVIAMHNKSHGGDENVRLRQRQSDSIVRWIRGVRSNGNAVPIGDNTPILILGDMNVLAVEPADAAHHLTTLLTGNIVDEKTFGPDCKLDWDDTNLVEVKPRHNSREKEFYTWRIDDTPFPPGALDRILYTDSVLSVNHSFVLNTTTMTKQELEESGLQRTDVLWEGEPGNYDHMPLVADFSLRPSR